MSVVAVSLGTNINREENLNAGLLALAKEFGELTLSSLYECAPVGFDGDDFYNMVIAFNTSKSLITVAELVRAIEFDNGREKNAKKFSARTLDLDILVFDELVCQQPVQLPRAEIADNAFVLQPLAELFGENIHPYYQRSYQDMWSAFDKSTQPLKKVGFSWTNNKVILE